MLSRNLRWQDKYADADAVLTRQLALTEKKLGAGHEDVATVLIDLAAVHFVQQHFAHADLAAGLRPHAHGERAV